LKDIDRKNTVFVVRLIKEGKFLAYNLFYLALLKDLNLSKPNITKKIRPISNGYEINLSTDKLAKSLYLSIDKEGSFSDNFFDLLPGEKVSIIFKSKKKIENFKDKLKITSLVDTY
jgi:beta-mannosidase